MNQYKIKWKNGEEMVIASSNIEAIRHIKTDISKIETGDLISVKEYRLGRRIKKERCLTKYLDSCQFWKILIEGRKRCSE